MRNINRIAVAIVCASKTQGIQINFWRKKNEKQKGEVGGIGQFIPTLHFTYF